MSTRFVESGYPRKIVAEALGLHRSTLYKNKISSVDKAVGVTVVDEELALRIRSILDEEETLEERFLRITPGCLNSFAGMGSTFGG